MSVTIEELVQQARQLPPEERARLADILLESLQEVPSAEIEAAWDREIEARIAAYERGESKTYPAEEVFAEAGRLSQD
jgi:putative addiction module component (TIGR02574 family)